MLELGELITVVIPVYNEERNLPGCLKSLEGFPLKVAVDSGSTDSTAEIARAGGCEILSFEWNGHFPKKRNWALQTFHFKTPWVLFMDADERMTPAVAKELALTLPSTTHDCFRLTFDNWFMGRMLRHGDPMRKTALLRIGKGAYERIEEDAWSNLPMEMHEHIVTEGTTGDIRARMEHHDRRSLSNYYSKHCDYADWEARRFLALKGTAHLTARARLKYRLIRNKMFPFLYFMASYIFRLGFLDGAPGFYFAVNKLSYFYQIQAKIRELEHSNHPSA